MLRISCVPARRIGIVAAVQQTRRWQSTAPETSSATHNSTTTANVGDDSSSGTTQRSPPLLEDAQQQQNSSSARHTSFLDVLKSEMAKLPALLRFRANEGKIKAVHLGKVMQGTDGTPEELQKEEAHKEAYKKVLSQKYQREQEAYAQKLAAAPSLAERMKLQLSEALEAIKHSTSKKSGVAAIIQHCTAAHAAEVAVEQGIDVKNVQIVLEKQTTSSSALAENESKIVGYIDAPEASDEEVAVFAQRLTKACPAARTMEQHIEWRRRR